MIFRYASNEFEQDIIPKCNICGNDLVVKLGKKHKPKKYEYYQYPKWFYKHLHNNF